jgi:hypothetical protein
MQKTVLHNVWPHGQRDSNFEINVQDYVERAKTFFGHTPVFDTGNVPIQNAPIFSNFSSTVMWRNVYEAYQEENNSNWFGKLFKESKYFGHSELMTEIRLEPFQLKKLQPGSPTPFTTTKMSTWFNTTEFEGAGFELSWFFFDDEKGRRTYDLCVEVMAAVIDRQMRINIYRRFEAEPDHYEKWLFTDRNPIESMIMATERDRKYFNIMNEEAFASFQKVKEMVDVDEIAAQMDKSDTWIICRETNANLIFNKENTRNDAVGQYPLNGDGAINHLESMADVRTVAGQQVCIQQNIIIASNQTWNPFHRYTGIQNVFIMPNPLIDSKSGSKYESRKRDIGLFDSRKNRVEWLTFRDSLESAIDTLEASTGKDLSNVMGDHMFEAKDDWVTAKTQKSCVDSLQEFFQTRQKMEKTDELSSFDEFSAFSGMAYVPTALHQFLQSNKTQIVGGTLGSNGYYQTDAFSSRGGPSFYHSRASGNTQHEKYVDYLKTMGMLTKQWMDYSTGPGLTFNFGTGNTQQSFGKFAEIKTDKSDWAAWIHFLKDSPMIECLAISAEALDALSDPKATATTPLPANAPSKKFYPLLIRWDNNWGTASSIHFQKVYLMNPFTSILSRIDAKRQYKDSVAGYLQFVELFFLTLKSDKATLLSLVDYNINPGLNVLLSNNPIYHTANMLRLRKLETMSYARAQSQVIVHDNPETQRHTIKFQQRAGARMLNPRSFTWVRNATVIKHVCGEEVRLAKGNETRFTWARNEKRAIADIKRDAPITAFLIPCDWTPKQEMVIFTQSPNWKDFLLPTPSQEIYGKLFPATFDYRFNRLRTTVGMMEEEAAEISRNDLAFFGPHYFRDAYSGKDRLFRGNSYFTHIEDGDNQRRFSGVKVPPPRPE